LPDLDSTDRHGWWGDLDAEEIWGGWSIGCKNWLLSRSKITDALSVEGSTLARAKRYTQEALQPFIDKRVATRIEVSAVRTELERIVVEAKIYRGPTAEIDLRYQLLWQEDLREDAQSIESNNKNIRVPYRNLILSTTKPQEIFKPKGELILSRFAPSVDRGKKFSPPSGNLILSSIAPKAASYDLSPPNANLIISSINPTRSP
jgi:phage gp46-like protein